jgi:hypothetical protein
VLLYQKLKFHCNMSTPVKIKVRHGSQFHAADGYGQQ